MTQNFVRYGPEVEQPEPDFERTLQAVLDDMKQHMRGSLKTEGIGFVARNAHAKGYGLARRAMISPELIRDLVSLIQQAGESGRRIVTGVIITVSEALSSFVFVADAAT